MGCTNSGSVNVTEPGQKFFFIAGYPSAGKTWMGDYLASRGWEHVDGDLLAHPECQ